MENPHPKRADDERLLTMVHARSGGMSSYQVAEMIGLRNEAVRTAVNRVRDADLRESGEPVEAVRAAYWG